MSCVCPQIVAIVRIVTRCVVNVGVAVHVWANHRVKLVDYVQSVYLKTIIVVIEVTQPTLPTVLKIQILKTGKTSCFYPFLGTRILGNRENTGVGYFTDRKWVL